MVMRIISGKYKNKEIFSSIKGVYSNIKPTTSKVKEAAFNIISSISQKYSLVIQDLKFLDLCCGIGSIGIEAISRDFDTIYFIDNNYYSIAITKHNLMLLKSYTKNYFYTYLEIG